MKVRLEDVCDRGSSNLKQSDIVNTSGNYPIYGASGYISNVDFYHQDKPYVAVVKDGAGIGRTTLHPAQSSVIGTMQYLIPKENILPEYLYYVVRYMHLEKYFTGATIPHIYFKDYKNEQFNLDSLEKQKEIIDILGNCERVITKREEELQKLDKLIKARFVEMFGDPVRNTKMWHTEKLYVIAPINKYKGNVDVIDGKVWLLNLDMIESCTGNILGILYEYENRITSSTIKFDENCVLYSKLRPYLNKVVIPKMRGYATSELISMSAENINKYFLANLLRQDSFVDFSNSTSYGAKMPRASMDTIKNFDVIMPPIELQNQFATFVEQVNKSKVVSQHTTSNPYIQNLNFAVKWL